MTAQEITQEWLVTDQNGGFAMGTLAGVRTRKYHGFYSGVAGRAEASFFATMDLEIGGQRLWPERYEGAVSPPKSHGFRYEATEQGPRWVWEWDRKRVYFQIRKNEPAGTRLSWKLESLSPVSSDAPSEKRLSFRLRPLFAMRSLHSVGGKPWQLTRLENGLEQITETSRQNEIFCRWSERMVWKEDPVWYRDFFYSEERIRGYTDHENLFSAGVFEGTLEEGKTLSLAVSENAKDLEESAPTSVRGVSILKQSDYPYPALDFVLENPAGVVAGFPWFGEWGRDTFVALPGLVCARLDRGEDQAVVRKWTYEVLDRWGVWIESAGMLPNVIEREGAHQWESADGTLWYCHALAALWVLSLDGDLFPDFEDRFAKVLQTAIRSIHEGRHVFLNRTENGLLEVTEAHATWMDAKVDGAAVTPRTGILPEINSLWFQALFLEFLWSGSDNFNDLEKLGNQVLQIREPDRPNTVFLHSLPLAPSFVLKDWNSLRVELKNLRSRLVTPFGLRSLSTSHPNYHGVCAGSQQERDEAYHQGSVWGWLQGHYEMAEDRAEVVERGPTASSRHEKLQPVAELAASPIEGHIPEIFDGDFPHLPRGAPAQAWSLACKIEYRTRKVRSLDSKLSRILARRWSKGLKEKQG